MEPTQYPATDMVNFTFTTPATKRLIYQSYFCPEGADPFDQVSWHTADVTLKDSTGKIIFEQKDVESPVSWSERAVRIVAQKYFRGRLGTPERESSVRQIVQRVVDTIWDFVIVQEYFETPEDAKRFRNDLAVLLLTQKGSFNSPVWFNLGVKDALPQVSACFPYETRINTDRGLIPIGEVCHAINHGQTLWAYDLHGNPTQIIAARLTGIRRTSRIFLADGSSIAPTVDHRLFIRHPDGSLTERLAGDTKVGDQLVLTRIPLIPTNTETCAGLWTITPDIAWLAGLMVGDGYSGRAPTATSDTWEIKVSESVLQKQRITRILIECEIPFTTSDTSWGWIIRGYGATGRAFWERLDLWDHTHNKKVPEWVFRASRSLVTQFIQGLFDADGCVPTQAHLSLYNTSFDVIENCRILLRSLGIFSTTTEREDPRTDYTRKVGYTLLIADTVSIKQFKDLIGFTHEHKQKRLEDGRAELTGREYRQDAVEITGKQRGGGTCPVFDLQTEAGVFWVEGVLVHNCFIQSVEDDMQSIADLQMGETLIFKRGSGTGTNFSNLRSKKEHLTGGGTASGPVSFMKGLDAWAGVIKSGGKTRRAAKMAILNVDHPDILEFIECKLKEEQRAQELAKAGYSMDFDDPEGAYASVAFQNANHAVRVTDEFMRLVQVAMENSSADPLWPLIARTTNEIIDTIPVRTLWNKICEASHVCGDPGMQFDTITNKWHTCPSDGRINATNPCSEFAFLDNTSCNLASLNLMAFADHRTEIFDEETFQKAVAVFIIAQDALVDQAFYPTERIAEATKKYRALGLGYTNLGAFLMANGVAYDSDAARSITSEITSLMTATAYLTSAKIAGVRGPFEAYERNQPSMESVLQRHREEAEKRRLRSATVWERAIEAGKLCGFRNAQTTLLAPTGTISFMMDCDTTGCEPEIGLYKVKKLVGGGSVVMENRIVDKALRVLGYDDREREGMLRYLGENKTLEGCSWLRSQHWPVFDCALPAPNGKRSLTLAAHLDMMMAIQPFISGAISKTVNMAESATPTDIGKAFFNAWQNGIKNIIIYRNRSKLSQPIESKKAPVVSVIDPIPARRKLRDHQNNVHRIKVEFGQVEGYVIATPYEDTGLPGEIFVVLSKEGSTISGLVDGWATGVSLCLQYGVPLEKLVDKFSHAKFEPAGFSTDPDIRHASSIYDAIIRKLAAVFLSQPTATTISEVKIEVPKTETSFAIQDGVMERPICTTCGSIMQQNGATCYVCPICGSGGGCS